MKQHYLLRRKLLLLIAASMFFCANLFAQIYPMWQTDNTVYTSTMTSNTLYIGGDFNYVGPYTGTGAIIPEATGNTLKYPLGIWTPMATKTITAMLPDGLGGAYIATSSYIMHTGTPFWSIPVDGQVNCLYLSGAVLYAGGSFSKVNGNNRKAAASIATSTGAVTPWNPLSTSTGTTEVLTINGSGSNIYLGGLFSIAAAATKNLVAVSGSSTGSIIAGWANPNPNRRVWSLLIDGTRLFAGGDFSSPYIRNGFAEYNLTGTLSSFDPGCTGSVRSMALSSSGSTLYLGGTFFNFQTRNYLLAINTTTGVAMNWNPNPSAQINKIALSGNRLYVAGDFRSYTDGITIGGQSRNFMAAIDATTGMDDGSWVTRVNGKVNSITISGTDVYMGGEFTSTGGERRNRVAAIDYKTNLLLPWDPDANGTVRTLLCNGNKVYAGGDFTFINGQSQQRLSSLDHLTGAITPGWSTPADKTVRALYAQNGALYAGGDFTTVGGFSRNRIVKIKIADGTVNPSWNPNASDTVRTIAGYNNKIYAGGVFTNIGGATRNWIAALDESGTGSALAWYPPGGVATQMSMSRPRGVNVIAVSPTGTVYVGGNYTTIGGQNRHHLASVDDNGNVNMGFNANPSSANEVNAIYSSGSYLYIGGSFADMQGNTNHKNLAELDPATGVANSFFWGSYNGIVYTLSVNFTTMYLGGQYQSSVPGFFDPAINDYFLSFHVAQGGMIILPIRINDFKVTNTPTRRLINWKAEASATDGYSYEIERSSNGVDFISILRGTVTGSAAAQRLEETDNDILSSGTYYYRLKIIQANGRPAYSPVQIIVIDVAKKFTVFPTLITVSRLSVVSPSGNCSFQLINAAGQVVHSSSLAAGVNNIPVGHLSNGVYHYAISTQMAENNTFGKIVIWK